MEKPTFLMQVADASLPLPYSALKYLTGRKYKSPNNFMRYFTVKEDKAKEIELSKIVAYLLFQPEQLKGNIIRIPATVGKQSNADKATRKALAEEAKKTGAVLLDEKEEKEAVRVATAMVSSPAAAKLIYQCESFDVNDTVDYKYRDLVFTLSRYLPAVAHDSHVLSLSTGESTADAASYVCRDHLWYMQAYINTMYMGGDCPFYRIICDNKNNVTPFRIGGNRLEEGERQLKAALDTFIELRAKVRQGEKTVFEVGYTMDFEDGIIDL